MNPGRWAASAVRPLLLLAGSALTVFLAGCPDQQLAVAKLPPPNATAPALPRTVGGDIAATTEQTVANPRVASLILQVDNSYRSGVANYRGGRLDAARLDFDFAVDLMLSSGLDIKADPVLHDEFERTVDAVNSLEMDALKQGNGFSPKTEAAPLDVAEELTFKTSPELTASLKSTLSTTSDLPLVINDEVAGYINAFANSAAFRAHMIASLRRAGKYRELIQNVLKEEGVPQDLIYLAVAESGFQPQVVNAGSGAAGMWQFMPFQGAYGLQRNGYFDERFDPEKSSRAYARYIKSLYNQFGDWYLAMAGYNWGPGNVQRAVMRTGYADFWQLYRRNALPKETKNYVPQFLAAIIMAKNPEKYGLTGYTPDAAVQFDTVPVSYAMDLRLAADVTRHDAGEPDRAQSRAAAVEHAARHQLRPAHSRRHKAGVYRAHRRHSRGQAFLLALPRSGCGRNAGPGGAAVPRERGRCCRGERVAARLGGRRGRQPGDPGGGQRRQRPASAAVLAASRRYAGDGCRSLQREHGEPAAVEPPALGCAAAGPQNLRRGTGSAGAERPGPARGGSRQQQGFNGFSKVSRGQGQSSRKGRQRAP